MGASATAPQFYDTDLLANIFDVLPVPVLVIDKDVRIIDFNVATARLLESVPFAVVRQGAGETFACIHSSEAPGGCGHGETCHECVIRSSVREAFESGMACRKLGRMDLVRAGKAERFEFLVTAAPIPDESEPIALLMLEDATELWRLLAAGPNPPNPASFFPGSKDPAKARDHKTGNS